MLGRVSGISFKCAWSLLSACRWVMGWELQGDPHTTSSHFLLPLGKLLIQSTGPTGFCFPRVSLGSTLPFCITKHKPAESHNCYFENKHQSEFQHQALIPKLQTVLCLCIIGVLESFVGLSTFLSHKPQPLSCDLLSGEMQHWLLSILRVGEQKHCFKNESCGWGC